MLYVQYGLWSFWPHRRDPDRRRTGRSRFLGYSCVCVSVPIPPTNCPTHNLSPATWYDIGIGNRPPVHDNNNKIVNNSPVAAVVSLHNSSAARAPFVYFLFSLYYNNVLRSPHHCHCSARFRRPHSVYNILLL